MDDNELIDMYNFIKEELLMRNGKVVCFNDVIANCTGCNNNFTMLGSVTQSIATCFYLCGYLSKDLVPIEQSIPIFSEARKHIENFKSTAEDSGTTERITKHWLQRILNSSVSRIEFFDTQAAAYLLGMILILCSDKLCYYSVWESIRHIKMILDEQSEDIYKCKNYDYSSEKNSNNDDLIDTDDEESDDENENDLVDTDEEMSVESSDLENMDELFEVNDRKMRGCKLYTINENNKKIKMPVPWEYHYMYRGSAFSTFNRHEYFTLVRINSGYFDDDKINERLNNNESLEDFYEKQDLDEISKTNKNKSAGRKKNDRFPFIIKHPLAGTYHQTLISKQCTCILSGKPPPSYPGYCDKK